ncbi:MAG: membrane dipeptidase, partial [bacterium]
MKHRRITNGVLCLLLSCVVFCFACSKQMNEEQIAQVAERIHKEAITLDTHVDISSNYATERVDPGIDNPNLKCDLVKMEKGGLDGVFLAVFVGQRRDGLDEEGYKAGYENAMAKFEAIHRLTETMYPDRCELAKTPDDVVRIEKTGKRVILIGIENGYPIGMDLSLVKKYYDLGARYITLSHSRHNQICDSSSPEKPLHNGLSEFGKQVVAEMNRLGIMCDVSHISEKSFFDLIEVSKAPIIATHSGCSGVNPNKRNLTDDQLKALKKNGGVIQIVALGGYLKPETPEHRKAVEDLRTEMNLPDRREMRGMSQQEREALRPKFEQFQKRMEELEKTIPGTSVK